MNGKQDNLHKRFRRRIYRPSSDLMADCVDEGNSGAADRQTGVSRWRLSKHCSRVGAEPGEAAFGFAFLVGDFGVFFGGAVGGFEGGGIFCRAWPCRARLEHGGDAVIGEDVPEFIFLPCEGAGDAGDGLELKLYVGL